MPHSLTEDLRCAVHSESEYRFAVTLLETECGLIGSRLVLTLGEGNRLTFAAIELLGQSLVGREIEELMSVFGAFSRTIADHPPLRWPGPHKGVVHLALASLTNACFDPQPGALPRIHPSRQRVPSGKRDARQRGRRLIGTGALANCSRRR